MLDLAPLSLALFVLVLFVASVRTSCVERAGGSAGLRPELSQQVRLGQGGISDNPGQQGQPCSHQPTEVSPSLPLALSRSLTSHMQGGQQIEVTGGQRLLGLPPRLTAHSVATAMTNQSRSTRSTSRILL